MKCTNKAKILGLITISSVLLSACSPFKSYNAKFNTKKTPYELGIISGNFSGSSYYAKELCEPLQENVNTEISPNIGRVQAAAVFDLTDKKSLLNYNMLDRIYPASTTKILTALTAFKYGKLDQKITVSKNATIQIDGSSLAKVSEGDELTLRQLLYGLMLPSGNDAAVAIAEGISGSEEAFVKLMNKTAQSLGATNSNFVTASGLHDDNHYTTCYDMYLIISEALKYDELTQIMGTKSYDVFFRDRDSNSKNMTWRTTDMFLSGEKKLINGFTIVGGKTGTTAEAKYCLALITKAPNDHIIVSLVYKADNRYNLYLVQNEILGIVMN